MRIFKTKRFAKWAKKEKLTDPALYEAVCEMGRGLVDAQLGGGIYKKRVASQRRGKRGSLRTILAFKSDERAFFIFGFAKNKIENISSEELAQLKILGSLFMHYDHGKLQRALDANELMEIPYYE